MTEDSKRLVDRHVSRPTRFITKDEATKLASLTPEAYSLVKGEVVGFCRLLGRTPSGKDVRATQHPQDSFHADYKDWSKGDAEHAAMLHRNAWMTSENKGRRLGADSPEAPKHLANAGYHKHMAAAFSKLHSSPLYSSYTAHHGMVTLLSAGKDFQEATKNNPYKGEYKAPWEGAN